MGLVPTGDDGRRVPHPVGTRRGGRGAERAGGAVRVLIVTALITALIGGLCVGGIFVAVNRGELEGSGNVVAEQRQVAGFDRVELDGPGRLVVLQGDAEGLAITTDDNILEQIETEVEDGELTISFERGGFTTLSRIRPSNEILFELTAKSLTEVELNGTADLELDGFQADRLAIQVNGTGDGFLQGLRLDELVVLVNGASTFDVAGTADRQAVEINGSGRYRAAGLTSREATVEIDGNGEATVRVRESLDVDIDGRGVVEYIGSPAIAENISGAGELRSIAEPGTPPAGATPAASPGAGATPVARSATPLASPRATRAASPAASGQRQDIPASARRTPTPD